MSENDDDDDDFLVVWSTSTLKATFVQIKPLTDCKR